MKRTALLALALVSGGNAWAAQPAPGHHPKLELVAKLLEGSPAVARIESSDHVQAKAALDIARKLHARAADELRAGNAAAADRALNEALALIGKARGLVPDPAVLANEQRLRYGQMIASIESVQASYLHHLGHSGARPETDLRWQALSRLVDSARSYAGRGRFAQANQLLVRAEADLLAGLEAVLGKTTLEYASHFAGPQEEFDHELVRNRDYRELVPLAVTELKPPPDAVIVVDRYLNAGLALRQQAEKLAFDRDLKGALESIRRSTSELQRALLAAGLVVPKE